MAILDNVIEDVGSRFGLGPKAGPLLREVVQLITGSPGGIGGFIEKFRSAGLGSQVATWLGRSDGAELTPPQVEQALGSTVLSGIANRVGLGSGVVGTAIGYLLPKVIGQMTPGGTIPTSMPSWISGFLGPTQTTTTRRVEQVSPMAMHVIPDTDTRHIGRWLIPVLAGLGVLGLLWYLFSGVSPTQVSGCPIACRSRRIRSAFCAPAGPS